MALWMTIQLGCRGVSVSQLESPAYTLLHSQGVRSMHVWWAEFGVWSDGKSYSGQNVVTFSSLVAGSTLAHRVAFRCSLGQLPPSVMWCGRTKALWLP